MNSVRRSICKFLSSMLGLPGLAACSQPAAQKPQRFYTQEEQQRMHKFRGVWGYELAVDIFPKRQVSSRGLYCKIVDDEGRRIAAGIGIGTARSGLPPKTIHATLFDDTDADWKDRQSILIGYWTVPVADRIPDDLLDDLLRDPNGGLRIKIRLHREGVLLGWDIERRPGYDVKKRDQWGSAVYVAAVHSFAGGDFREADIYNGKPVRLGWYIHPKTKELIESDF